MASNWGAIIAGLAGGASSLGQSMSDREKMNIALKRQAALDAIAAQTANSNADNLTFDNQLNTWKAGGRPMGQLLGGVKDASAPTGAVTGGVALPTNLPRVAQLAQGISTPLSIPGRAGATTWGMDPEQAPEAIAMRKLIETQKGQQKITDARTLAAEARARETQKEIADRQDKQIKYQTDAAERLANKPQRVQVDDGNGGVKWAWLRPGQEAPVGKTGAVGGGSLQGSQAPLDDMIRRYDEIEAHGKDLGAKKFRFTNTNATREALGFGQAYNQAEGKPAIGAQLGQSAMDLMGMAKADNPDQQRYARLMASTRAFGDDAAKVFKGRQGFQNISYEVAQATLRPEDYGQPEIIAQKLNRMRHVVKLAALVAPQQAAAANPADLARFMTEGGIAPTQAGKPNPEY